MRARFFLPHGKGGSTTHFLRAPFRIMASCSAAEIQRAFENYGVSRSSRHVVESRYRHSMRGLTRVRHLGDPITVNDRNLETGSTRLPMSMSSPAARATCRAALRGRTLAKRWWSAHSFYEVFHHVRQG